MHPNMAKHLHTEECNALAEEYEKCNKENKYGRYLGVCTDLQNKMTNCFQNELKKRRQMGSDSKKKDIEHYIKQDPKLAEKVRLLEELKAKNNTK